ncbi:MAG: hypothetical protein ABII68_04460 [Pseudomonadota bacterium]
MTKNESSKFRIRLDDDVPEAPLPEGVEDLQIKRLGQRVTLVAVLIPCLIGVVLFLAYMDINKRVGRVHDTGTTEVQNLSNDLESRFTSLSKSHDDLKDSVAKQIESLQQSTTALDARAKEVETAILYIRDARKIDNNKFDKQFADIETGLTSIQDSLEKTSSDLQAIDTKVSQELIMLAEAVDKFKQGIQSEISNLSATTIDKKGLDLAMISQQVHFQEKLKQITARYDADMESLRKRLTTLENSKSVSSKPPKTKTEEPPTSKAPDAQTIPPEKPAPESTAPKSDSIIEQDIR